MPQLTITTTKACSTCGQRFHCGAASGHCWCFDLPKIIPVPKMGGKGCLCPDCLKKEIDQVNSAVQVTHLPETTIAYLRNVGPYGPELSGLWKQLRKWAKPRGLWKNGRCAFGIAYDDPMTTAPEKCRYDAGIEVDEKAKADGPIKIQKVAGGNYLMVPLEGTAREIGDAFQVAMGPTLAASGRNFDPARPLFERYSDLESNGVERFRCDLCVPVK